MCASGSLLVGCSDDEGGDGTTSSASSGAASGTAGSTSSSAGEGGAAASGSGGATTSASGGGAGGPPGDTWTSYAMGFFATYCVECHGAGDALRDYTTYEDVSAESAEIRCGVTAVDLSDCSGFPPPSQFPVDNATASNPKPSDAERARLVAWIEAGLPM